MNANDLHADVIAAVRESTPAEDALGQVLQRAGSVRGLGTDNPHQSETKWAIGCREAAAQTQDVQDADNLLAQPSPQQAEALAPLLRNRPARLQRTELPGVVVGTLVAIADAGRSPLVLFPGPHGNAAIPARAVVDLHSEHVGKEVALSFENGDATHPIVLGVLRDESNRPLPATGQVEFDADGQRMIVAAREQLVLRCGEASITLTKAGKVLIEGTYVSSKSDGVNRIKGGSIQLN